MIFSVEFGVHFKLNVYLLYLRICILNPDTRVCFLQGGVESLRKYVKGPSHAGICSGNTAGCKDCRDEALSH